MASEFVPTSITFYGSRAWEPRYDAAYRWDESSQAWRPRRRTKAARRPGCLCGTGKRSIFARGPLALCEGCMRHTLELQLKGPPPEKRKAPAKFTPKSNRAKRRAKLQGAN